MKRVAVYLVTTVAVVVFLATVTAWIAAIWKQYSVTYLTPEGRLLSVTLGPHQLAVAAESDGRWMRRLCQLPDRGFDFDAQTWGVSRTISVTLPEPLTAPTTQPSERGAEISAMTIQSDTRWFPLAHHLLGFGWHSGQYAADLAFRPSPNGPMVTYHTTHLPYWSLLVLSAIPPVAMFRRWRRRRRRVRQGLCLICGYDLRSTPDRCPECGTAAVQSAA